MCTGASLSAAINPTTTTIAIDSAIAARRCRTLPERLRPATYAIPAPATDVSTPTPRNRVLSALGQDTEAATSPPTINNTAPTNQQLNEMVARRDAEDGDSVGKPSEING